VSALRKVLLLVAPLVIVAVACSTVKKVVVKDIAIEDQKALKEEYVGRSAWTRGVLEDLGEGGSVPRDTKVEIFDIEMVYNGAVTVETEKKRERITHGLEIERPLSPEKIHERMDELFWFKDPVLRHVDYIRKWGSKTARAVVNHEVFIGMTAEAALESWGVPAEKNVNEIGGKVNEQWVYPSGNKNRYIYIIDGKVSKWEE
jgi:hypothetical protein